MNVRNYRQTGAFEYHDQAGNILAIKRRYDFTAVYDDGSERKEKTFRVSPSGLALPLYHLPAVLSAVRNHWPVYLTEGEAKADLLNTYFREDWGTEAAASSYGGHWRRDMVATLKGASVVLVPDRDAAGKRKAERVIGDLHGVAASIALCDITDLLAALEVEASRFPFFVSSLANSSVFLRITGDDNGQERKTRSSLSKRPRCVSCASCTK